MLDYLRSEGIEEDILQRIQRFREQFPADPALDHR